MWQIGVWEEGEGLRELAAELVGPERAQIHSGNHPGLLTGEILDLLVVSPSAVGWAGAAAIYCRTVLLPDSAGLSHLVLLPQYLHSQEIFLVLFRSSRILARSYCLP